MVSQDTEMKKGDLDFDSVYDEFHSKIGWYLELMVGKSEAEDLTQEVFMKVNKGLKGFEGKSSLSTWIYRLATNAALDKLQSRPFRENKQKISLSNIDASVIRVLWMIFAGFVAVLGTFGLILMGRMKKMCC
jgi:DNA-directed RNA polymerase specialized sigma24 family protein